MRQVKCSVVGRAIAERRNSMSVRLRWPASRSTRHRVRDHQPHRRPGPPARLADYVRGYWGMRRCTTSATRPSPRTSPRRAPEPPLGRGSLRILAIAILCLRGWRNIAAALLRNACDATHPSSPSASPGPMNQILRHSAEAVARSSTDVPTEEHHGHPGSKIVRCVGRRQHPAERSGAGSNGGMRLGRLARVSGGGLLGWGWRTTCLPVRCSSWRTRSRWRRRWLTLDQ
jgi:hypothetical protein